jgi:mRNA interferase MazF
MELIKKGMVVYVNLNPVIGSEQGKTRPAIIIQHDALNKTSNTTIVVPISSRIYDKEYPMHVRINELNINGTIKVEQIRVIDKSRIQSKKDFVSNTTMKKIGNALQMTCDYF